MPDRFPHVPHGDPATDSSGDVPGGTPAGHTTERSARHPAGHPADGPAHDVGEETDATLVAAIDRAHSALRSVSERGLEELGSGTSAGQLQMLERLEQVGESRLTDLAAALGVAPSTATRLCDGLAARELIVRRRRGQDRRVLQIHLTSRGRALMHAVHDRESSDQRRSLGTIALEERIHLATALSKIADEAERSLSTRPPPLHAAPGS